jgi:hypothetical protein
MLKTWQINTLEQLDGWQDFAGKEIWIGRKLTIEDVVQMIINHKKITDEYPTNNSGHVIGEPERECWNNIAQALYLGTRGLRYDPNYKTRMSLGTLMESRFSDYKRENNRPLTIDNIMEWADQHYQKTGKYPNQRSGRGFLPNREHWGLINNSLLGGGRKLVDCTKYSKRVNSLSKLLWEYRKVQYQGLGNRIDIIEAIEKSILSFVDKNGECPAANSGLCELIVEEKCVQSHWNTVDNILRKRGSSLSAETNKLIVGKYDKGWASQNNLQPVICSILEKCGGRMKASDMKSHIEKEVQLTDLDKERLKTGRLRWHVNLENARLRLQQVGRLKVVGKSVNSEWELVGGN